MGGNTVEIELGVIILLQILGLVLPRWRTV